MKRALYSKGSARHPERRPARPSPGFTLIELIGVMAIMAIIAGVMVPNVLKQIELAEVRTEAHSLNNLASQMSSYTSDTGIPPTTVNWAAVLAPYSDLGAANVAANRRGRNRVLLKDNNSQRYLFLSVVSVNAALALPPSATMATAQFQQIWNTSDNAIPPVASWPGWAAWAAVPNSAQLLVLQRVNLSTTLQTYQIALRNNSTAASVRYQIFLANGTAQSALPITILPGATVPALQLLARQRIDLYPPLPSATPYYTYVIGTSGKSFDYYDGTSTPAVVPAQWRPQ